MTDQRSSSETDTPRTDWNDIGSICRTFGNEREAVTAIFSGRMEPGRNFWKEAADEIARLRGLAQAKRVTAEQAAIDVRREREAMVNRDKPHPQPDGFINDYD